MLKHMRRRTHLVIVGATFVLGAALAGGVVAAHLRAPQSPAELDAALKGAPLTKIADIPAAPGLPSHGVFLQTSQGLVCLWDAPSATSTARQGGCNTADDPLGGHLLSVSLAYDGGPDARSITDARLFGLVAPGVAELVIAMTDGTRRTVPLRGTTIGGAAYRAFGYRFKPQDLRRGIGPTAVLALDAKGVEIDRQATGFGG